MKDEAVWSAIAVALLAACVITTGLCLHIARKEIGAVNSKLDYLIIEEAKEVR